MKRRLHESISNCLLKIKESYNNNQNCIFRKPKQYIAIYIGLRYRSDVCENGTYKISVSYARMTYIRGLYHHIKCTWQ